MNLKKLQALFEAADKKAKDLAAAAGDRLMTADEKTAFDGAVSERNGLSDQIKSFRELQESDRTSGIVVGEDLSAKKPFATFGEQLGAIMKYELSGRRTDDARILAALGNSESVDSDGGFLVQPEFGKLLIQNAYETGILAKRCFDIPMSTRSLKMPAIDEKSRANGSRWGGIQGFWEAEAALLTASKSKVSTVSLEANKLTVLSYITSELQEDAPALGAYISKAAPDELGFKLDDGIYNGTGAGMPLGILNAPALVTVAKDSAQPAATISTTNVINMQNRMPMASRAGAAWFIQQDLEPQLWQLVRAPGSTALEQFIYTPPGERGNNSPYGMMLGSPVIPIEQAAAVGTPGDIVYADLEQYFLGQRGVLRQDSSIHVGFISDELAFRFILRVDGQPAWKNPVAAFGTGTLRSPFVALAVRS
jgi:HK97 family phage major capsid protein